MALLLAFIVACEVGFWVLLAAGLVARYPLRRPRLGAVLLASTPVVDLALFVATIVDLRGGGSAGFMHGLAAAYIWFSISFGHSTIRWVDQRFAHRFAGGPPPAKPPATGTPARLRYEWRGWLLGLLGWAVACGLLAGGIWVIGDPEQSRGLVGWIVRLSVAMVIWLIWPVWETAQALSGPGPRGASGRDGSDSEAVEQRQ